MYFPSSSFVRASCYTSLFQQISLFFHYGQHVVFSISVCHVEPVYTFPKSTILPEVQRKDMIERPPSIVKLRTFRYPRRKERIRTGYQYQLLLFQAPFMFTTVVVVSPPRSSPRDVMSGSLLATGAVAFFSNLNIPVPSGIGIPMMIHSLTPTIASVLP